MSKAAYSAVLAAGTQVALGGSVGGVGLGAIAIDGVGRHFEGNSGPMGSVWLLDNSCPRLRQNDRSERRKFKVKSERRDGPMLGGGAV